MSDDTAERARQVFREAFQPWQTMPYGDLAANAARAAARAVAALQEAGLLAGGDHEELLWGTVDTLHDALNRQRGRLAEDGVLIERLAKALGNAEAANERVRGLLVGRSALNESVIQKALGIIDDAQATKFCATAGHEATQAIGIVRLATEDREHPYCGECIDGLGAVLPHQARPGCNVLVRTWRNAT